MATDQPSVLTFSWNRAEDHCTWKGLRAHGVTCWLDLARILAGMGIERSVRVVDERGVRCWTMDSIAKTRRFYFPTEGEKAIDEARAQARKGRNA